MVLIAWQNANAENDVCFDIQAYFFVFRIIGGEFNAFGYVRMVLA